MEILEYRNLNTKGIEPQYNKVVEMLRRDDFSSADVKKMANRKLYRAKIDRSSRLLFKLGQHNNKQYALILEVIRNHSYESSRFLNGAVIDGKDVFNNSLPEKDEGDRVAFINKNSNVFNILDKIISFDQIQDQIYRMSLPLIIIGPAGSGKTALTLEKIKLLTGDILYVTLSEYLAKASCDAYYSLGYMNEGQNINFLCFREFLETIRIPQGREVTFKDFQNWFNRMKNAYRIKNVHKLFEEFKGVISGRPIESGYLSEHEYLQLGVKQSIFSKTERIESYKIYLKYLSFLKEHRLYDTNLLSFDYLNLCPRRYDFVVIDEVQDLTNIQLSLILKSLNLGENTGNFLICGDSNQIVHPNFFSWSSLKSMFYKKDADSHTDIIRILNTNYRNSPEITEMANKILKIKTTRFGSIDRESHYLMKSNSKKTGHINFLQDNVSIKKELNKKTKTSVEYALIVMRDEQKAEVKEFFKTPLVFSIQEVKGLEYKNIILYNIVSSSAREFNEIASGLNLEDLDASKTLSYSRSKDKEDKSLEIYKFFINSLYVAVTRSIQNFYWIESVQKHNFLQLLEISDTKDNVVLEESVSNLDDWKKEADKLLLQGKKEQAEQIHTDILKKETPPWIVCTVDKLPEMKMKALEGDRWSKKTKKKRQFLFEYGLIYDRQEIFEKLKEVGFKRAFDPYKEIPYINRTYYSDYFSPKTKFLRKSIEHYGVDYRNIFNETPLMCAVKSGNIDSFRLLMESGANEELKDNYHRTPRCLALKEMIKNIGFPYQMDAWAEMYRTLSPRAIDLKINNQLIKIDRHLMEHFLLNLIETLSSLWSNLQAAGSAPVFNAVMLSKMLEPLPTSILLQRRKKRAYISSILSNNEIYRNYKYNRYLFFRVRLGQYTLNPLLEIRRNGEWVKSLSPRTI